MTLTQTAILVRRGVFTIISLTVLVVAAATGYKIWYQHYLSTLPPIEEKAEMRFGLLPEIKFPPSIVSSSNFSYSLDTVTGGFPQMPKLVKVYFIPQNKVSFLAPEKSQALAQSLGFLQGPQILSETRYKFTDQYQGNLIIDLTTGNFNFQRQVATDSAKLQETPLTDQAKLVVEFKDFLQQKGLLPEELKNGRSAVIYGQTQNSASESAQVSVWPEDFEGLPIVTASFKTGLVTGLAKNLADEFGNFTKLDYIFWPIDKTTFSTYQIKTPEEAFKDLQSGKGFVALEPPTAKVSISSVYLAYFQSEEYSPYLKPVYVFEGPSFAALVEALSESISTQN
jgi:hypothetical protein